MRDLISRNAAIALIHSLYPSPPIMRRNRERWEKKYKPYIEAEKALEMLPSVQPEIIRCGECTHKDKKIDYCHCLGITICERDFCSFAERKTDGRD